MAAATTAGAGAATPQPPRQYKLAPQSELRVEVLPDAPLRVRLVTGTAEIFGTELPPEGWVPVPPRSKIAVSKPSCPLILLLRPFFVGVDFSRRLCLFAQIFTWHGATVELDGVSESEYTSDEVSARWPSHYWHRLCLNLGIMGSLGSDAVVR